MAVVDTPPDLSPVEQAQETRKIRGDAELKRQLQELCQTDNLTNWLYLCRAWLVIALSVAGTAWAYTALPAAGISVLWTIPVALLAIFAVGASQHQLAGATHEATHHTLFKNKLLNELASEWLCMYPLLSSTYTFRLYHLVHHQFINDPERDPDFVVLAKSGHWLDFPIPAAGFFRMLAKQATVLPLVWYMLIRGRYNSLGIGGAETYRSSKEKSKLPETLGLIWVLGLLGLLVGVYFNATPTMALLIATVYYLGIVGVLLCLPSRHFHGARLRPVIPLRYQAISRLGFIFIVNTAMTYIQMVTGAPVWGFYLVLWMIPLLTTFSLFMILRQVVQHGNGDRGWLTNTRTFLVNPFVKYAVFPFGMDYHLPHHMYATVPHYNLPKLHEFLMQFPEYRQDGIVVENYFFPKSHDAHRNPTVVEVLGPDYAQQTDDIYIDNSVLDNWEVEEKDQILAEGQTGQPT